MNLKMTKLYHHRFHFVSLLVIYSCFVVITHGADNLQRDNSESRTYEDFLHDASVRAQHLGSARKPETTELAEKFVDAVSDIIQPLQRMVRQEKRKALSGADEYSSSVDRDFSVNDNHNDDDDGDEGKKMLRSILDKLEDLQKKKEDNTTSSCIRDTGRLIIGLMTGKPWALPFIDSTGKPGPALMKLHLDFVGDYDQCRASSAPAVSINTTALGIIREDPGFDGNYCNLVANVGIPFIVAQIGVCMPSSCSSQEVTEVFNELIFTTPVKIPVRAECRAAKTEVTTATVFAIIILVTVGIMMILGTSYDLYTMWRIRTLELPVTSHSITREDNQNSHLPIPDEKESSQTNGEATPLLVAPNKSPSKFLSQPSSSVLGKVLLAFSMYTNGKKLLNASQAPGSLGAIHGIRFLSMSWVVMCHFYSNLINGLNGIEALSDWVDRWTFLPIANGFVCVDTFFTLSGLLTAYLTIKEMNRKSTWKVNWPMFYFHRFWRLTPPYMFAIVLVLGLTQYFGQGPLWKNQQPSDKTFCEKNWWTNFLYVNNLVNSKEMCFGHSWYLANDMQFFILSPLMLIPFYFSRLAGIVSCLGFLLITTVTTGALSSEHDWPTTMVTMKNVHSGAALWFNDYYIKPWCRMGPFITGVLAGYILAQTKGKPFRMPWYAVVTGWATAIAAGLAVVYGLRGDVTGHDPTSTSEAAFYNAVARAVWGACVSWVIVACSAGYGGPIQSVLSWSPFVLLGRLTYMAYLVHLCILAVFFGNMGAIPYVNDTTAVVLYLGLLFIVNMVSFVLVLALESPMVGLERAFLRPSKN